jgi:hypothetical protein
MSDVSVASEAGESVTLSHKIHHLQDKHTILEQALAEEEARPMPDSLRIASLKRKKLAIKDELAELTES